MTIDQLNACRYDLGRRGILSVGVCTILSAYDPRNFRENLIANTVLFGLSISFQYGLSCGLRDNPSSINVFKKLCFLTYGLCPFYLLNAHFSFDAVLIATASNLVAECIISTSQITAALFFNQT